MKKVLKTIGKILRKLVKWYVIFDVLCIMFIGIGTMVDEYNRGESILIANEIAFEKSIERIKNYFKR